MDKKSIRYDTIEEFNLDSKAEYSALSSTRNQKKKLKQTTPVNKISVVVDMREFKVVRSGSQAVTGYSSSR